MQSIDDEIPDLSGPVSLGTYRFTRRGRGKKYETHKLSELQEIDEKEVENKVTESTSTPSTYPPFNPPSPTTLPSFQLFQRSGHQKEAELNDGILNRLDKANPDRRSFHELGPPHYDKFDPSHRAGISPNPISSIYTDRRSSQVSDQAKSSVPLAQDQRSGQNVDALINPGTLSSQTSGQIHPLTLPEFRNSNQQFSATVEPYRQSSQPASAQADTSLPLQGPSFNQNFNASINTDQRKSQASRRAHPSFPQPVRHLDTSRNHDQLLESLNALIKKSERRSSKASGQTKSPFQPQGFQPHTPKPYLESESKVNDLLAAHRNTLQESSQANHPASPKDYSSPQSLPLSDTLRTASFNLETNEWDPDLPEANMSAQTPTNKSTRGGHSGQQSSHHGNPHAIVTTTKAGRPYTNPYMPIDPPPSMARQSVREYPYGNIDTKTVDQQIAEHQLMLRCIEQEEARYRALEEEYERLQEPLDDPFQDQPKHIQHHGRNQPSNFAEHAAQQAAYGGPYPEYRHQPTFATYTSDPSASSLLSKPQQITHAPNAGMSPYHGEHSAYQQQPATNPRASVRLPAVRGTIHQQKTFLQEPELESLSLDESIGQKPQDQRRRQQGGAQPASARASHAVPIRDPAAYTGSGLSTRRNQEALRQNLDTVFASSQGPTGSARTVMNDPQRDHQPLGRSSSNMTDTTVTGSTLRAQAPSYEFASTQRPVTTNPDFIEPRQGPSRRQGRAAPGEIDSAHSQHHASNILKNPERAPADTENRDPGRSFRAPTVTSSFDHEVATYTKNAGLPAAAIGAGNKFMNDMARELQPKQNPRPRLDDAVTWFRTDPRDLSYAAAILPRETMNRMNPEQFPLEAAAPHTAGRLADGSQDDDPSDRARQAATPRPIGHGRPAGSTTPPSNHGPRRTGTQHPFSTLAGVSSVNDIEGMARSGRKFLDDDARAIEAMFGGVYNNLMAGKHGPYDYTNHYAPPPAYAIDHNAKNDDTLFDPQWFATAPPARVGRDPRREQGEYEDPTQGSAVRRGDHVRGDGHRRESGGRGGAGSRAWGRI